MQGARSIAAIATIMVACSPYSKRDIDEAKQTAAAAMTATASAPAMAAAAIAPVIPTKTATAAHTTHGGLRYANLRIQSSVEDALVEAIGKDVGTPLSQIAMRVLVWWIDVRKDFRKGDRLELVYETKDDLLEPLVLHAVWFQSQKLQKAMSAVRYKPAHEQFARWYTEDGEEVEMKLEACPVDTYEQITSLLNDGRRHKGVDFKCPVGTPVRAPFDGVVVAKNWGRRNGNCLEIRDSRTGNHAKLLHLDKIEAGIGVGARVKLGQVIAQSGNTGRSTAPHLHYQLENGSRLLDPFAVHKTYRAKLSGDEAEKAKAALAKYAALRMGAT